MDRILEYLKKEREKEWRVELRGKMKTKERTSLERLDMPESDPNVRNKSYIEVNKGLSVEQAMHEAHRCIDCPKPTCIEGCPVGINIPKFIKKLKQVNFLNLLKY